MRIFKYVREDYETCWNITLGFTHVTALFISKSKQKKNNPQLYCSALKMAHFVEKLKLLN